MSKINTSIGHLKTFLLELEEQSARLEAGTKASCPKARAFAQKMRVILGELRKDLQDHSNGILTKPRTKHIVELENIVEDVSQEVTNPVTVIASVMEEMPEPLSPYKSKSVRKPRVSKK